MRGTCSLPDPYLMTNLGNSTSSPYKNIAGRTQVYPALVSGESTGVFVTAGQSNGCGANFVDTAYSVTNTTKNQTLNQLDGGVYQTQDPLLAGGFGVAGSWGARLADKLITAGIFARVVLIPTDVGGTAVATWEPGSLYFDKIVIATKRALAVGLPISGYIWHQGEADTDGSTTQTAYAASLANIITSLRAYGAGFQAPWFVGLCSWNGTTTSSAVRAAQAAIVNGVDIFQGPDSDTLTGTSVNRQSGNLHFKAAGADALATLAKTALDAVF